MPRSTQRSRQGASSIEKGGVPNRRSSTKPPSWDGGTVIPTLSQRESGQAADRAYVLEQLLDLAYDVSSYLRRQSRPVIRVSAALLLAASLAACGAEPSPATDQGSALSQEVKTGLPTRPGVYQIVPNSIARDSRGVYHFSWLEPGTTGSGTPAALSLARLTRSNTNQLEIAENGDPVLHLREDAPIALASTVSHTYGSTYHGGGYVYWYPFPVGGTYYGSGYYDPPARTIPSGGGTISGANHSTQPLPPAQRTFGVSSAVSGRAGGTGSGTAATSKSGADLGSTGGKSSTVGSVGGKSSSVAPASSSSFSSGRSSSSSSSSGGGSSSSGSSGG